MNFPLTKLPNHPTLNQIRQAHSHLIQLGLSTNRTVLCHLLSLYALVPSPSPYPLSIYSQIEKPNTFAANNLIRCLAKSPTPREAVIFYRNMREDGIFTNNYTYTFVLQACSINPKDILVKEGKFVHAHIAKFGFVGDLYIKNALISFYIACSEISSFQRVFDENSLVKDVVTWNSMLVAYARVGEAGLAEELFDKMPNKDAISWSSMLVCYVQNGILRKALSLFKEMVDEKTAINESAFVTTLSASAQLGLLQYGKFVHGVITNSKHPITMAIVTSLVDMYAKCGSIRNSREVFDKYPKRNVSTWNAMLCGLAAHGLGKETIELYEKFISEGLLPNSVTFVGVLNACSRAGLVDEGKKHFDSMHNYGIEREMEHYGCMVDLLSRAGFVSEALTLVEGMSIKPDPVLWGTLLGACKIHGLVDLGVSIGNKLIELEPIHNGNYVLLSSIYANTKKWEDVSRIRRLMYARGSNKVAGWSLIEANGKVHKFVAGDKEHEECVEIYKRLEMINGRLGNVGYWTDVSPVMHDIGEEEKIESMKEHSERLAIAYGLMVVDEGEPIRIVKNLRVCGDCHEFTKMVSKVFDREIVVRDGSRFHHFEGGVCSCCDFW